MRVTFTPETEEEKARMEEIVHENVSEFFVFGNKVDADDDITDFHEWKGEHRYLLGSLQFFYEKINEDRGAQRRKDEVYSAVRDVMLSMGMQATSAKKPEGLIKHGALGASGQHIQTIDTGYPVEDIGLPEGEVVNFPPAVMDLDEDTFGEDTFGEEEVVKADVSDFTPVKK